MLKQYLALLYFSAAMLNAQSRVDLLRRAANFYNDQGSFAVKGVATARVPGTSWQIAYDASTEAAQPRFIPVGLRKSSLQVVSTTANFQTTRVIEGAIDPFPNGPLGMVPFGQYENLTDHLIDAQKIGHEVVTYQGRDYKCEVIDATYDTSPDFKPNSASSHRRIYIDPDSLWVLKETQPDSKLGEYTFVVTSLTFNQQPSAALIEALAEFAEPRKSRPEWQGRNVPDLTLADLSGNRIRLAGLRGHAVLLDFWGSYCAPCKRTAAFSEQLASTYRSAGLIVWGVTQDTPEDARSWLNFHQLSLPSLLDPDGAAFKAFEVKGVPAAILIDEQGKVVRYWEGVDDKSEVQTAIEQILNRRR